MWTYHLNVQSLPSNFLVLPGPYSALQNKMQVKRKNQEKESESFIKVKIKMRSNCLSKHMCVCPYYLTFKLDWLLK